MTSVLSDAVFALFIVTIGVCNMALGRRWSHLDYNPWADKPLGGLFSGPKPGLLAGNLDVATINARGQRMMFLSPIACAAFLLFFLHTRHYF